MGYTQRTALTGRKFESLDQQNTFLSRWNERWAFTRIHGTTKRQVREMFAEERPALQPLPSTRFEYYRALTRRVHFDGHIEVDGAYYSAPPRYAGMTVAVHAGALWLRILDPRTQQLVREHSIIGKGQRRTQEQDRPPQTPLPLVALQQRIARIGPATATFARAVENERGRSAARILFGVLDLVRRYDAAAVEQACALAVDAGAWRLRFLRAYLARHGKPTALMQHHPVIPAIATYTAHFATLTQGDSRL